MSSGTEAGTSPSGGGTAENGFECGALKGIHEMVREGANVWLWVPQVRLMREGSTSVSGATTARAFAYGGGDTRGEATAWITSSVVFIGSHCSRMQCCTGDCHKRQDIVPALRRLARTLLS